MYELDHFRSIPGEHRDPVSRLHAFRPEGAGHAVDPATQLGVGMFALVIHERDYPRHHAAAVGQPIEHRLALTAAASSHGPAAYRSIAW